MPDLKILQAAFGYQFRDINLLRRALTHRSVEKNNNERLEFLGDAVLNFVMADVLFDRYKKLREGELSRVRAGLVNGMMLAELARRLELGPYLLLGQGEKNSGGQERDSILADTVEAIIAAVYLDSDMETVKQFVVDLFDAEKLDQLTHSKLKKDPKSALQEWTQARRLPLPTYDSSSTGMPHEQVFSVTCFIEGVEHKAHGQSSNRRRAEQLAAKQLLKILNESGDTS